MTLIEELRNFLKAILHWIYALIGFTLFFFLFGPGQVTVYGRSFVLPVFTENSFSVWVFKAIEHSFIPPQVSIIVTNPMSGFIAQLEIAIILAFVFLFPFFLYKIIKYLSPALLEHEKKVFLKSLVFSTVLFFSGCFFAYYYMIPLTFEFMYPFTTSLGVEPFFSLDAFMSWVITILIATGVTFLLPVFMILLSFLGIVSPDFWKSKWRVALLFLLIFSAVITPDQTGITMVLLFIPLAALYSFGTILTGRLERYKAHDTIIP
jgi:sec-independent protein translocase protein TatC